MKNKKGLSLFNYVFIAILVVALISSAVGMFFVGGYNTSESISMIFVVMAVAVIMNSIYHKIFVKEKEKDYGVNYITIFKGTTSRFL